MLWEGYTMGGSAVGGLNCRVGGRIVGGVYCGMGVRREIYTVGEL